MIRELAISAALASSAYAGSLPLAYEYNPSKESGEYVATVNNGTQSGQVEVHVFGREDVISARLAGQSLARNYPNHGTPTEMEAIVREKAINRYGGASEMVRLYVNEARVAYIRRMRELNVKNGLSIQ